MDYRQYLLRSDVQIAEFREKYPEQIDELRQRFVEWVNGFPVMERVDYLSRFSEKQRPFVVGMLCILIIEGAINITFHDHAQLVHRNPRDVAEWEAWRRSRMPKRKNRYTN